MPSAMRPGDILTGRYRLIDLLNDARGGRFWRAWDGVLARPVAVHLIARDDPRAETLLDAARRSAQVIDPRLLRVLDAGMSAEWCYVVNEWGEGPSLDIMLAEEPLPPRRAAWVVGEVAELVAAAHGLGLTHGRLVPENVMIDDRGAVKVIGFAVDAALHGITPATQHAEFADLVSLLYAALTGKWPGPSRSKVPAAPRDHGKLLRPRQVRAGVPRVLDSLCDTVLNPLGPLNPRTHNPAQVALTLFDFIGDRAAVAEAEARRNRGNTSPRIPKIEMFALAPDAPAPQPPAAPKLGSLRASEPAAAPSAPPAPAADDSAADQPFPNEGTVDDPGSDEPSAVEPGSDESSAHASTPHESAGLTTTPAGGAHLDSTEPEAPSELTQAAPPDFDDEILDPSWRTPSADPSPPPPPFEESPERPLFAPLPADGKPVRTPRADLPEISDSSAFWPWGTDVGRVPVVEEPEPEEPVPGRGWMRGAWVLAVALLVLLAVIYGFNRGREDGDNGGDQSTPEPTSSSAPAAAGVLVEPAASFDFDPEGGGGDENPDRIPLAFDGDPATAWPTQTYRQNFGPGGLKNGVGLLIDLGSVRNLSQVAVDVVGEPTELSIYTFPTTERPRDLDGAAKVADGSAEGGSVRLSPPAGTTTRWVAIWLTKLPSADGFRGQIAEVQIRS